MTHFCARGARALWVVVTDKKMATRLPSSCHAGWDLMSPRFESLQTPFDEFVVSVCVSMNWSSLRSIRLTFASSRSTLAFEPLHAQSSTGPSSRRSRVESSCPILGRVAQRRTQYVTLFKNAST